MHFVGLLREDCCLDRVSAQIYPFHRRLHLLISGYAEPAISDALNTFKTRKKGVLFFVS